MSANYFFSITEIAREICLTLEDDKESLFHLALCDKAISETALDVLWMNMKSLRPFMPFIPKGLSEVNDIFLSAEDFLRIPCPPPAEWETFDKYARRVRELCSADARGAWMDGTRVVYARLAAVRARAGADLFPNLRSLACFLCEPGLCAERLLPSSLRSLTSFAWGLITTDEQENTEVPLTQVALNVPLLESLTLRGALRFSGAVQAPPMSFAHIRAVDLTRTDTCDAVTFWHLCHVLSGSPVVKLSMHLRKRLDADRQHPSSPIFPLLQALTFCGDPEIAHDFLDRLTSTTLRDFTIEHEDVVARLDAYQQLISLLHTKFSHSLKSIYLNFGYSVMIDIHRVPFLVRTLVDLMPIVSAGLEELRYTLPVVLSDLPAPLSDALMPSAWPTLKIFDFTTRSKRLSDREREEQMKMFAPLFANIQWTTVSQDPFSNVAPSLSSATD